MASQPIKILKVRPSAVIPGMATPGSAGADLCACIESDIVIVPGQTAMIPTGIAAEIPEGTGGFIFARSGLASKSGLAPANKVGVIDSDYRGELTVALHNHGNTDAIVSPGQRIAQLVIMPVIQAQFIETDCLSGTERGDGGFGSTGK